MVWISGIHKFPILFVYWCWVSPRMNFLKLCNFTSQVWAISSIGTVLARRSAQLHSPSSIIYNIISIKKSWLLRFLVFKAHPSTNHKFSLVPIFFLYRCGWVPHDLHILTGEPLLNLYCGLRHSAPLAGIKNQGDQHPNDLGRSTLGGAYYPEFFCLFRRIHDANIAPLSYFVKPFLAKKGQKRMGTGDSNYNLQTLRTHIE